eukprot:CAMPEP_0116027014 /NCGR_PEP_ID=MMETSP0321-20121206/14321_1 /TAXON_ID=163516 /ORGANISM="Leptocylindrus danicus var. danicus, Strain B650" /LENGTH=121 /DNA_ID=CAMNT_0003500177 /DNA_START=373 /DNA_END=738 /DNA_ORIENTATION=-
MKHKVLQTPHQVFLYDIEQMADVNITRSDRFRMDLGEFIGVDDLGPMMHKNSARKKIAPEIQAKKINICDAAHDDVREVLMKNGVDASRWIRTYFLESNDVHCSSCEFLREALAKWEIDPC